MADDGVTVVPNCATMCQSKGSGLLVSLFERVPDVAQIVLTQVAVWCGFR